MKSSRKKRKINYQKIFNFMSFIFLATCVFWYGGRFIHFYLENNKNKIEETTNLTQTILNKNLEDLKNLNNEYYFYGNTENNYVEYSNILWRIIKITPSKQVVLIADSPITNLAYGEETTYLESNINKWLNSKDKHIGILEQNLNKIDTYLSKNKLCIDEIDNIEDSTCKSTNEEYYIGLLSLTDYINTGASESFINNKKYTYLSNTNKNNKIWYLNNEGKVNTASQDDIYGIKPVITLSSKNDIITGNGSKEDPYKIEKENGLFGSFVKLGNDIWRIYQVNDKTVKLVLNDYIKKDNENLTYKYSANNYYHNDTKAGSLAHYLNNTYLNSLSYKNIINSDNWSNYYYSNEIDYDYKKVLETTIDTKVSILSIGDIILNNELNNYFTNTGTTKSSNKVYTINNDGSVSIKNVTLSSRIVPCISINKDLLTKGSGTKNVPYETE